MVGRDHEYRIIVGETIFKIFDNDNEYNINNIDNENMKRIDRTLIRKGMSNHNHRASDSKNIRSSVWVRSATKKSGSKNCSVKVKLYREKENIVCLLVLMQVNLIFLLWLFICL